MWDIQKGNSVRIFAKHTGPITAVSVSPTGKVMASAASDNKICLWDLGSGNCIKTMEGHEGQINSLEFSQNGEILASGSSDDTVRVWRVNDASTAPTQTVAGSGTTGAPKMDKPADQCLKIFPTKRTPVYSVSFTKRNIMIALGVFQKQ
jgi:transcription initiation factor TFIID subunit 5